MILTSNRKIQKFNKQITKLASKLLRKISTTAYLRTFGIYQLGIHENCKNIIVTSNEFLNLAARKTIVNTLIDSNFVREDKWTTCSVIGFMDEVINLFTDEADDEKIEELKQEISNRYNVPVSRLKTQVALFINNLYAGNDNYGLLNYFSAYEIVKWKYRDINKLQQDVENNKLLSEDRQLLEELEII